MGGWLAGENGTKAISSSKLKLKLKMSLAKMGVIYCYVWPFFDRTLRGQKGSTHEKSFSPIIGQQIERKSHKISVTFLEPFCRERCSKKCGSI